MSILGQPITLTNLTGVHSFAARAIPPSFDTIRLSLNGTTMIDPALRVVLLVDFSSDNGVTWATSAAGPTMNPYPIVVEFQGAAKDRQGNQLVEYFWESPPIPDGTTRMLKGTLTITGAPLTTIATISATKSVAPIQIKG